VQVCNTLSWSFNVVSEKHT